MYKDLRHYISSLEENNWLMRVKTEVNAELEIAEISNRMTRSNGPALLFEKVTGYTYPVLINAFGSMERMSHALCVNNLEEIGTRIEEIIKLKAPDSLIGKIRSVPKWYNIIKSFRHKILNDGPCKEIIKKEDASLENFPVIKCYPGDGGKYITLPIVITKDPETKNRNVGMYRMQVFDAKT
ncbi:UbiD family decarboxylase, partial [Candidatus Desantisbacteria bacterium]|nr:UbiD family decarboxylase [Candidatus Desantisbacteria bacterium]